MRRVFFRAAPLYNENMLKHVLLPRTGAHPFAEARGNTWRGFAFAFAAIALATLVGFYWITIPDPRNLSLLFFGAVLVVGVWGGLRPALIAAFLAFFSYNFFLIEPRLTLHFAPADFLAFFSFLIVALVVGGLSGRLSDRARDAMERLRDLSALFQASRDLSGAVEPMDACDRLVGRLHDSGCGVALWMGEHNLQLRSATGDVRERAETASGEVSAFMRSKALDEIRTHRWLIRVEAAGRTLGVVSLWPADGDARIRVDRRWIDALLELGAIAIDRARLIGEVAETSIVAEKEGLRTALLSSLSHDLRTPLATILASATALQEHEDKFDRSTRREMLVTIQEETDRLNRYVANLLDMTRLESGALHVRSVLIDPDEAAASAIDRAAGRLKDRKVLRRFHAGGKRISVDPVLLEQALINILENAASYSPASSTILVATDVEADRIVLSIEDEGPGIPAGDLDRVFDKFFRGRSDRRPGAGVGLGLSVSRGLVEAFGGRIRAAPAGSNGRGARIEIRLPAHPALEAIE